MRWTVSQYIFFSLTLLNFRQRNTSGGPPIAHESLSVSSDDLVLRWAIPEGRQEVFCILNLKISSKTKKRDLWFEFQTMLPTKSHTFYYKYMLVFSVSRCLLSCVTATNRST